MVETINKIAYKFKINFELIDRMSCNVAQNLQNANDY